MKYFLLFAFLFSGIKAYCQSPEKSNDEVAFAIVENVPVYKGCEKLMSNDDKRKCMSKKISELVVNNFDSSLANRKDIPVGIQKITVLFKISIEGYVVDIQARASHPDLEKEVIRVINLIPKLKPGFQDGKPVVVPYYLPISFNVEGEGGLNANKSFPIYNGCNSDLGYELLKKCTTERIMDFVKLNINVAEVGRLFPLDNSTQFQANFVIDKKGEIKDIKVKAHKREMAALAIKTLKRLPKLKLPKAGKEKITDTPFEFLMTLYFD